MLNCPATKSFKCVLLAFLVSYAGQSANVLAYINQQPYDVEHISVTPQSFNGESTTLFGSDIDALLLVPQGFEQGFRQPAIEATARRFESLIAGQVAAGADLESVSSNLTLTVFFIGDLTGATQLGEGIAGVDLASNQMLSTGESFRRGVQDGSTIVIIAIGPKALRNARARSAGLLLQPTEAALTVESTSTSAVRARVLANIAESQAAKAASNFEAFAARERGSAILSGTTTPGTTAIVPFFPSNNGFLGQSSRVFLSPGQNIDRFGGSSFSRFFSPAKTPAGARALPPGVAAQPLRTFEVLRPFEVEAGTVAPAFDQLGLGIQFRTPVRLEVLLNRQLIREIPR